VVGRLSLKHNRHRRGEHSTRAFEFHKVGRKYKARRQAPGAGCCIDFRQVR
jgi:hypothetical protein